MPSTPASPNAARTIVEYARQYKDNRALAHCYVYVALQLGTV